MTLPPRRLALQLTPLLDLLLIVIFAQYLDVQQNSAAARQQLAAEANQLAAERAHVAARWGQLALAHQQVGDQLATSLDLPRQLLRAVTTLAQEGRQAEAEQIRQAAQRLQEGLQARGPELLEFVTRYDEMQKHVSIWDLYLTEQGQLLLSDGQREVRIGFDTRAEFMLRTVQASKTLAEPRTLVLLLFSYGDAQARHIQMAEQSLPELARALRDDAGLSRWYDYSLLGFRPGGPLRSRLPDPEPAEQLPRSQ